MKPTLIAWAILDRYNYDRGLRYCYAGKKGSSVYKKKLVAIYFTKPKISKHSPFYNKKAIRKVKIELV